MHNADSTAPIMSQELREAIEKAGGYFGFSRYKGAHPELMLKCYLDPEAEAVALMEYLRNRGVAEEQIAEVKGSIFSGAK